MVDTSHRSIVHKWFISAVRIKIVFNLFLQWLLGTGSVNTTARSDAPNAMHTDQVNIPTISLEFLLLLLIRFFSSLFSNQISN